MDEDSIFIEKHMGLIIDTAWKHFKKWMIYEEEDKKEDVLHEGMVGLIRARDKFDKELGYQFSTYAHRWIWGKMSRYVEKQNKIKKLDNELYVSENKLKLDRSGDELEYSEVIVDNYNFYEDTDLMIFIEELDSKIVNEKSKVSVSYSDICKLLIKGYSQNAIARELNTSTQTVYNRINDIRKIIQEEYLKCS